MERSATWQSKCWFVRFLLTISFGLNKNQKALSKSKVLIIGVSYKKDINDCRESPALDIIELLKRNGVNVNYYDPFVPSLSNNNINLKSLKTLNASKIKSFDACAIITNHSKIDYNLISQNSNLVIDTRNVFPNIEGDHILRLGQR